MTGFNTQATMNNYQIQVFTDNPTVYAMIENYVQHCLEWEHEQQKGIYLEERRGVYELPRRKRW